MCCNIVYLDLHLSLNVFQSRFYFLLMTFVFHLFTQWFLIYLIRCMCKFFFYLYLGMFLCKKHVENFYKSIFFHHLLISSIWSLFFWFFNFFPWPFYTSFIVFNFNLQSKFIVYCFFFNFILALILLIFLLLLMFWFFSI